MKKGQPEVQQPNILIVDDTQENLQLLARILKKEGYVVRPAVSGARALAAIQSRLPDLILLDIKMPEMDGFQVCERLKADPRTRDIPIIFISALQNVQDKVEGLLLGGVDYITKPFQPKEVLARVRTHLALRACSARLEDKNIALEQEVARRKHAEEELRETNQQLQEANASKDTFFSIIAHDLRTPFTSLLGLLEASIENLEFYSREKLAKHLHLLYDVAEQTHALLENLLTWSRLERGILERRPERLLVASMVAYVLKLLGPDADRKQITVKSLIPPDIIAHADPKMTNTVLRNLLSNALKFTESGGAVTISAQNCGQKIEIAVSDTGIGISQERIEHLFRIDVKTSTPGTADERGSGLGLILCKELVENNEGTLRVESEAGKGSTFVFTLPKMEA